MTHPWHDLSPGDKVPHEFEAVIEIPLHANIKYELDKKSGIIRMDRVLTRPSFIPPTTASFPGRSQKTTIRSTFSCSARNPSSRSRSCTRAPPAS
jgi:Inorganic pyrophosphatase